MTLYTALVDDAGLFPPTSLHLSEALERHKRDEERGSRLRTIEGLPPLLISPPDACRFEPRCRFARDVCREKEPQLTPRGETGHQARCWATDTEGWIA